jgi:hypothetical protein
MRQFQNVGFWNRLICRLNSKETAMGTVRFSDIEKQWIFSYKNELNCPFFKDRHIKAGAYECMKCPAFISVERNQNDHATELKCRGMKNKIGPFEIPRRKVMFRP